MKSVFDDMRRGELQRRIDSITTDTRPRWGKMNAEAMLAHLTESLKVIGRSEHEPRVQRSGSRPEQTARRHVHAARPRIHVPPS